MRVDLVAIDLVRIVDLVKGSHRFEAKARLQSISRNRASLGHSSLIFSFWSSDRVHFSPIEFMRVLQLVSC